MEVTAEVSGSLLTVTVMSSVAEGAILSVQERLGCDALGGWGLSVSVGCELLVVVA
jgi:hypothetical protein